MNYLQRGEQVLVTTDSGWGRNFKGGSRGAPAAGTPRASDRRDRARPPTRWPTHSVRDHPPYGRWAHIHVGADGTPNPDDVTAEVARGRVLVRIQLPADRGAAR